MGSRAARPRDHRAPRAAVTAGGGPGAARTMPRRRAWTRRSREHSVALDASRLRRLQGIL